MQNRLIWLVGTAGDLASLVKELAKSRHIIQKYEGRHQTISKEKQRLWFEEQGRGDGLEKDVQNAIAQVFTEGQIFFRGRQIDKSQYGTTFNTILERVGESILPELGVTVPKRENCTLRLKALAYKHLSHLFFNNTLE